MFSARIKSILFLFFIVCWPIAWAESPDPKPLHLASVSALAAPLGSEEPRYQKRSDWVLPLASITKLMTAMVVLDSGAPMDEWLEVKERHFPAAANAFSRLRPHSEAQRSDLLKIALMASENYAAYLLARHHPGGYDAFIDAMNAKADSLGMQQTHFVDSSGLSDANVSTAQDLMKMVGAAYGYAAIRAATTTTNYTVRFRKPGYSLHYGNTNPLTRSSRWEVGLSKTGYLAEAGRCLVMVTEVEGQSWIMVLLDSFGKRSPLGDAGRIRRWLTTGDGGAVASAAARYEREKAQAIEGEQSENLPASEP